MKKLKREYYINNKKIERYHPTLNFWFLDKNPEWNEYNKYRLLKSKTTIVPFEKKDMVFLMGKILKSISGNDKMMITQLNNNSSGELLINGRKAFTILYNYTFDDGSIVGKKVNVSELT